MTIFSRLMLSYLALLVMATGVSGYAILQLGTMRGITHSIILLDTNLLDLHKNMADALLSASRAEQNISIMWEPTLLGGYFAAKQDFERYLAEAMVLAQAGELHGVLVRLQEGFQAYQALFAEVVALHEAGRPPPGEEHRKQREERLNEALAALAEMKTLIHQRIFLKVRELNEAGIKAQRMVVAITVVALALGLYLSLRITRSITLPLARMQRKTVEIAAGVMEPDLDLPSLPEMATLARAFNTMCARLREVDRMKSDFYSLMSHELRTPLTSIREGTNLILEGQGGEVTERQRKLLTIIAEESDRLITLVNSLLDLSRLEAGMVPFHFSDSDLRSLVDRTHRELLPLAESRNIRLEQVGGEVPPVAMDAERIRQVLRNLVGNALKFTPRGGTVRVVVRATAEGVEVSVADTGPGIPREYLQDIFEKFRQASPGDSRLPQGTGLGLAIAKHIVQAHGGRIWAESETGRGTTFTFVLPV